MRNGAPFKDWVLPGALGRVRQKLKAVPDGDRQMVRILAAALTDGLAAVEAACSEALGAGLCSSDVVLNALSRQHQPEPPPEVDPFSWTVSGLGGQQLGLHVLLVADGRAVVQSGV